MLTEEEVKLTDEARRKEVEYSKKKTRLHFTQRMQWIKRKRENRENESTPDMIDVPELISI